MTPLQKKFGYATEFVMLFNLGSLKVGDSITLKEDRHKGAPCFWNSDKSAFCGIEIYRIALPYAFKKHQLIEVSNCPRFSGFVDAHFIADLSESNPFCKYPIAAVTCDYDEINGFKYARKHSGKVHIEFEGEPFKVSAEKGAEIKAMLENENE